MTQPTRINLSQKRLLCHCLTEYWLKFDDLYPGDLMRREIETKNKMMTEISELRSKIRNAPTDAKNKRRYQLEINKRERIVLKAATKYTYVKLNHESEKLSTPIQKINQMENDMYRIADIFKLFKF